jgi:imidazoleglycerol-phosphate dehydratase
MKRKTKEVDIEIMVRQGPGEITIDTGDKVLDHMLTSMFFYMGYSASIRAKWDLRHHLWEDTAITLAEEMKKFLGNIKRFGNAIIPMDDALILVSVDISRAYLNFGIKFEDDEGFELSLVREFLSAFARTIGATIHVKQLDGFNAHHITEATFKGLGIALGLALEKSDRVESTKGSLR